MPKHNEIHYFDVGKPSQQFCCYYDMDFKTQPLWYTTNTNDNYLFGISLSKGFRTKEGCENYIRHRIKVTCKQLLRN